MKPPFPTLAFSALYSPTMFYSIDDNGHAHPEYSVTYNPATFTWYVYPERKNTADYWLSVACASCGADIDGDGIEHDGSHYCGSSCLADAGFVTLEDGDIVSEDEVVFTVDDEWQRLDDCVEVEVWEGRHGRYTAWYMDGDSRIAFCEDTQDYRLNECTITMRDGTTVSDEADVSGCEECGEVFWTEEMHHNDGCCYCDACQPSMRGRHVVKNYSANVIAFCGFAPNPRNLRTYGVELEVEEGDAESVHEALNGEGILKEDGSLNDGFEIVTRPAPMAGTIATILRAAEAAKGSGSQSFNTNTCGFHVHIARKGLSDLRIGKLLAFVQSSDCKRDLEKVAQRSSSRWAAMGSDLKVTEKPSDRYTALNLQNEHTIELRIFKGTLHKESLIAYLTFTEALVEWSRDVSLADCYRWDSLTSWLKSQKAKKYHTLLAWMDDKGCRV